MMRRHIYFRHGCPCCRTDPDAPDRAAVLTARLLAIVNTGFETYCATGDPDDVTASVAEFTAVLRAELNRMHRVTDAMRPGATGKHRT
jgi:hypothetical protein